MTKLSALLAATVLLSSCAHKQPEHVHAEGCGHDSRPTAYHDAYQHHDKGMGQWADERRPASAKSGSFACNNAPAKKWGTYWCAYGEFTSAKKLVGVTFGTCEGSNAAEEEEPVDQVELGDLNHDASLAGTSQEWKDASAFNVTSKEHGPATLLIQPVMFKGTNADTRAEARLKVTVDGQKKDIRLTCGSSLK